MRVMVTQPVSVAKVLNYYTSVTHDATSHCYRGSLGVERGGRTTLQNLSSHQGRPDFFFAAMRRFS